MSRIIGPRIRESIRPSIYTPDATVSRAAAMLSAESFTYQNVVDPLTNVPTIRFGFCFSPDGLNLYVYGGNTVTTAGIRQYTLSVPFDLATAVYANKAYLTSPMEGSARSLAISADGTKIYFTGTGQYAFWQLNLSTPLDLATASLAGANDVNSRYSVNAQAGTPSTAAFSPDGTVMLVMNSQNDTIYQYTLSTPWLVESATYASRSFATTSQETVPWGLAVKPDGTKLYVIGTNADRVFQYSLSTPWDLASVVYDSVFFQVGGQEASPVAMYFSADGTRLYVTGTTGDDVNQYALSTAWDLSTASYVRVSPNVGDNTPHDVTLSPDGSKMYIAAATANAIRQFSLPTPWDVSVINLDGVLHGWWGTTRGVTFNGDGTMVYITSDGDNSIIQRKLRVPYDVLTAVPLRIYDTAIAGMNNSGGLSIAPDGSCILLSSDNSLRKYDLPVPYDLTSGSAIPSQTLAISGQRGHWLSADGSVLFIVAADGTNLPNSGASASAYRYNLSTPFDLSTATLASQWPLLVKNLANTNTNPYTIQLSPGYRKLFILGNNPNSLYELDLSHS